MIRAGSTFPSSRWLYEGSSPRDTLAPDHLVAPAVAADCVAPAVAARQESLTELRVHLLCRSVPPGTLNETEVRYVFSKYDADGNGVLNVDEVRSRKCSFLEEM